MDTSDTKVLFTHTKNLCVWTVFEEEEADGNPMVYPVVEETRAQNPADNVHYVSYYYFRISRGFLFRSLQVRLRTPSYVDEKK